MVSKGYNFKRNFGNNIASWLKTQMLKSEEPGQELNSVSTAHELWELNLLNCEMEITG